MKLREELILHIYLIERGMRLSGETYERFHVLLKEQGKEAANDYADEQAMRRTLREVKAALKVLDEDTP
jgi:hypothetical protein